MVLAYDAYTARVAYQAIQTGIAQRKTPFPTFDELTGRQSEATEMSATMMAHNIRLWRHALGQGGGAQREGG